MILRHIYNRELAQASYLVGCSATGEALIVDPNRDIEQYIDLAAQEGLRVTAVTETHIHADFVSGARELAARTGAQLYLSDAGPAEWQYSYAAEAGATLLHDGDSFKIGNIRLDVLHTPGHTPEHLAFLVTDMAGADEPMGIFTGDFVFVGDVGRPDLLEKAAGVAGSTEQAARQLFQSLQRFRALPDYLQVWPGHGAGSACGRALGAVPQSTVGYEKRFNWALHVTDEARFVGLVLEGQPEPPFYFAQMKRINKIGPRMTQDLPAIKQLPRSQLALDLARGMPIVDTRAAETYAAGHVPGTINLPFAQSFVTWAGWLLPYDRPLALIADAAQVPDIARQLRLIGLDMVAGFWMPQVIDSWAADGHALATIERADVAELNGLVAREAVTLLDVRSASEYAAGHIAGSTHIPLGYLSRSLGELPAKRPIAVYCQSGARSAIGASILRAHGHDRVIDLTGGFERWQKLEQPSEQAVGVGI